jgi:SAM-dependent methyltransferase
MKAALPVSDAAILANLRRAGELFRAQRYLDAAEAYREVLRQRPKLADVHNNLGVALKAAGHLRDAIPCFKRAVRLKPDYAAALGNLASALEATGQPRAALDHRIDAWRLAPGDTETREALIRALPRCPYDKPHPGARLALAGLQADPDVDKQALSDPAIRLWASHPGIRRALEAALDGFPDGPARSGFRPMTRFMADDLILHALCWSVVADPAMEAWLTRTRRWILDQAVAGDLGSVDATSLAAIAVQARMSEWVWFEDDEESDQLVALADRQAAGAEIPHRPLIRAMYLPLETDPEIAQLSQAANAKHPDDQTPSALLLRRSLLHPGEESQLADGLVVLTEIHDTVSRSVRAQYEDNPYPRWTSLARRPRTTITHYLSNVLAAPAIVGAEEALVRILIAGCGTGRHALQTALRYENSEVFAVDLSRASLAYAKRMARDLRIRNVSFAQADILEIGDYPERFDLIESSGVLHHLDDPRRGWTVLRGLLAPRGLMRLAFYSTSARLPFDDVRKVIPSRGSTLDRIRAARAAVYALPEGHAARALLRTADFYAASGVRDALLHAREVSVDPLWIQDGLNALDLRFLGFELPDPAILDAYRRRFPNDPGGLNLAGWHALEADHPDLFLGMYQFWAQAA